MLQFLDFLLKIFNHDFFSGNNYLIFESYTISFISYDGYPHRAQWLSIIGNWLKVKQSNKHVESNKKMILIKTSLFFFEDFHNFSLISVESSD